MNWRNPIVPFPRGATRVPVTSRIAFVQVSRLNEGKPGQRHFGLGEGASNAMRRERKTGRGFSSRVYEAEVAPPPVVRVCRRRASAQLTLCHARAETRSETG
jgi:hypothetical protein